MANDRRRFQLRAIALGVIAAIGLLAGPAAGAQAACTAPVKSTAHETYTNGGFQVQGSRWQAQSFTLSSSIVLNKVSLYLLSSASQTQSITVEIRSDAGGKPGTALATRSAAFANTSAAFDELDFSADRLSLAAGTPYWIVAHSSGLYNWGGDTTGGYGGGSAFESNTDGMSWTEHASFDFAFQVFGQTCTADTPQGGGNPTILAAASDLALQNKAFAAESSGPPATNARKKRKLPLGTRVGYTLNEPASVRFTVKRKAKGRKVKRRGKTRCVKPTRKNRRKRKCTRLVTLKGSFTRTGVAGRNSFHFTGRLNGRKLSPGRYRLVATPSAGGKAGKPISTGFRIVR